MQMQSGQSWQIVFAPVKSPDEKLDAFIENFFAASACDYTDDGLCRYVGYSARPVDGQRLAEAAAAAGVVLPSFTGEYLPPENWLKKNVIRFAPLKTRDFYIYGSHESAAPRTTKHKLRIYAATAFGSGRHQTTRLCLRLVSRLFHRGFSPTGILDMGCGSGILALASLRLWPAARAVAADIDPEAVIVTLQNAADNNLDERINAAAGDGFDNPAIDKESPFELILANILARPLTEMAPQMAKHLRPGGHVVLSGFTAEQTDWVVNTYKNSGFTLAAVVKNQNWRAVLMEKTK